MTLEIGNVSPSRYSNQSNKSWPKCKKRPPKSMKNEILIFGIHSTSDDRLSDLSKESQPKCKKRSPESLKNEMLIFGLHSTSDDWLRDLSNESWPKCKKRPPKSSKNEMLIFQLCLSHRKMKCLFLDYIQLLMIGQAILAMKVHSVLHNLNF